MESITETNKINVWYITGATSGVGLTIAEKVLENPNNRVAATSRDLKKFENLSISKNPNFLALKVSGLDENEVKESVEKTIQHFGTITHVFNNAGYGIVSSVEETKDEDYKDLFEVLYYFPLRVMRAVLPHMRSKKYGYIFNVSSGVSFMTLPRFGAYSAAKSALTTTSNILAAEVKSFGINVATISLGVFKTGFQNLFISDNSYIEEYDTKNFWNTQMLPYFLSCVPGEPSKFANILVDHYANQAVFKTSNLMFSTSETYAEVENAIKETLNQFDSQKQLNTQV